LILDFDTLPEKPQEVLPILRFRLKKLVPFEIEHAMVSYQVMARKPEEVRVLVAVIPNEILAEYENVLRRVGYEPGAVLPSTLAATAAVSSLESSLIVNNSGNMVTTAIVNGEELLLHRTIDLPTEEALAMGEIQRAVNVTMAYFEDTLHAPPLRLFCAGQDGTAKLEHLMRDFPVEVKDLAPIPSTGYSTAIPRGVLAGVTGALAR
jgi:type IV pilus assembly protein PilM